MEEFEYDGNDILSIKMALENILEQKLKSEINNSLSNTNENVLKCAYETLNYIDNLTANYIDNWVEKKNNK